MRTPLTAAVLAPLMLLALGCAPQASSTAVDSDASPSTNATPADCAQGKTLTDGVLTIGTDSPAYDPWFSNNDPTNGKGFESAVAYAVAKQLGFDASAVTWTKVPFNSSYAPGPKKFDFDINQISITPERAKVVDFSTPYFDSNIGVLIQKGADVTEDNITSKSCAAYAGTTSVDFLQKELHCASTKIYPDSPTLYQGLLSGQVDADFLDTAIVLAEAKQTGDKLEVVGQYKTGEKYGAIYPKGSANEDALNQGIQTMLSDGTLDTLSKDYLGPAFGGDPSSVPIWTIK